MPSKSPLAGVSTIMFSCNADLSRGSPDKILLLARGSLKCVSRHVEALILDTGPRLCLKLTGGAVK